MILICRSNAPVETGLRAPCLGLLPVRHHADGGDSLAADTFRRRFRPRSGDGRARFHRRPRRFRGPARPVAGTCAAAEGRSWRASRSSRSPSNICFRRGGAQIASRTRRRLSGHGRVARLSEVASAPSRRIASRRGTDAPALAEALAHRLRTLAAIRQAGEYLMSRPRLGRDFFARGEPEAAVKTSGRDHLSGEPLRSPGRLCPPEPAPRAGAGPLQAARGLVARRARQALTRLVGAQADWTAFDNFLLEACVDAEDAPERPRVLLRGFARTCPRGQNRTAAGGGLRADLAALRSALSLAKSAPRDFRPKPPATEPFAQTASARRA